MADIAAPPPLPPTSSSTPPTPSSKPSSPSPPALKAFLPWLPLYLRKTTTNSNHNLLTLSKILSTPSGTDTILLLLGYSTLLTSTILTSISLARLRLLSRLLIEKAVSLPPNTVVLIEGHIPTSRTLVLAGRLKALSSLISDYRIFVRLWGLLGIWRWGVGVWGRDAVQGAGAEKEREGEGEGEKVDEVETRLLKAQVLVNVLFQVLENGAYLSSKGVMGWSAEKQNTAWLWSSRFWAAHVGLEFLRLGRVFALRKGKKGGSEEQRRKDGSKGDVWIGNAREEREWLEGWRKEVLVNAAWAPLTLHWSREGGLIGDFWVGVFGSVAGVVGVGKAWKAASS